MKGQEKAACLAAFEQVLKPLMRIAELYGVSGHELRDSFVQASAEFCASRINEQEGRPASAARVAMYTGLNASEVRARLTSKSSGAAGYARRAQALSSILNGWHSDEGYVAVYEIARDIPFADESNGPSFLTLCEKYGDGFEPSELLQDLVAANCVDRLDGGYLRPKSRTFVLPPGDLARLDRMGKVLSNFTETFFRILGPETEVAFGYTERTLVADYALKPKGVRAFDAEFRNRGTKLLTDLDSWMTAQQLRFKAQDGKRFGCGIYFFEDVASAGTTDVLLDEDEDPVSRRRARRAETKNRVQTPTDG